MTSLAKIFVLWLSLISFNAYSASKITIATVDYNPPFEIQSANIGEFWGFEIALMKEICKRIHQECEFKSSLFLDVGRMVDEGKADLAIASIVITPERRKKFLFSEPYKSSYLQYVIKKNNKMRTIYALHGKKVAVYFNSPSRAFVLKQFNHQIQLTAFSNSMNMLNALTKNDVDALITNQSQALYWIANSKTYRLLGPKFPVGEGYGIMAKLGRNDLINKVNQALLDMENDGTYLKIYSRSF